MTQPTLIIIKSSPDEVGYFDVYSDDGATQLFSYRTNQPFIDAAKQLLKNGLDPDGWMELRHAHSMLVIVAGRIGHMAELTLDELDTMMPQFAYWKKAIYGM